MTDTLRQAAARAKTWDQVTNAALAPTDHTVHACTPAPGPTDPTVSVIIPAWNCAPSLRLCLEALGICSYARTHPDTFEVIVCDDGSTDDTWRIAREHHPAHPYQALRIEHASQSVAVNTALAGAAGTIVVFLDADMIIGCGAIDTLVDTITRWPDAICAGFRSNISHDDATGTNLRHLTHREAFSNDNRVNFELPTIIPNMMTATGWLTNLTNGATFTDSQGHVWPRNRYVYGCLFAARRELAITAGGFPEDLIGWGFNDTLAVAAMEAHGGFIMPLPTVWGHHVAHELRDPDQWFFMKRNLMAYQQCMSTPPPPPLTHPRGHITETHSPTPTHHTPPLTPTPITTTWRTTYSLGDWTGVLDHPNTPHHVAAHALFELGHDDDAIARSPHSMWAALAYARQGHPTTGAALLHPSDNDPALRYAAHASAPEAQYLSHHFRDAGLDHCADRYDLLTTLIAARR